MRLLAILAILATLSGCAPEIVNKPFAVNMAVPVKCHVRKVPKPVFAVDQVAPSDSMFDKVKALIVANEQHKSYEVKLEAVNKSCQ